MLRYLNHLSSTTYPIFTYKKNAEVLIKADEAAGVKREEKSIGVHLTLKTMLQSCMSFFGCEPDVRRKLRNFYKHTKDSWNRSNDFPVNNQS